MDRFAIELGVNGDDPKRIQAGIVFELKYNLNMGHTFLPLSKLIPATAQLLSLESEDIAQRLTICFGVTIEGFTNLS